MKALSVLLALAAVLVAAQDLDPAAAEACLAAGRAAMREGGMADASCVGQAAQACEGAQPTTLSMNACRAAEAAWWDDRLNRTYGDLRGLLETRGADRAGGLREMQRAWIAWRDAACAYEAGQFAGGSLAGTVLAGCRMQRTAQQALWLAGELDRLERQ